MTPTFQFFEDICCELYSSSEVVLPEDTFLTSEDEYGNQNTDLLEELQSEYGELDPTAAVPSALSALKKHFNARGSDLPFRYDLPTRSFVATDQPFIDFIAKANNTRGVPGKSRSFEIAATYRLAMRGFGTFHKTGWPRKINKRVEEYNKYLRKLGFDRRIAAMKEKDCGFDILWVLPFGAIPRRPILSFQCKNGSYNRDDALASTGTAEMSFGCHKGLLGKVHTLCVVFNDYIDEGVLSHKPLPFVPLGLSDLAALRSPLTNVEVL